MTNKATPEQFAGRRTPPDVVPLTVAVLALVAAVVLPWFALSWSGVTEGRPWPAPGAPFGINRVASVHGLATLPLAWLISLGALRRWPGQSTWILVVIGVGMGTIAAALSVQFGSQLNEQLGHADSQGKLVARVVWSLVLVLPWCVAIGALLHGRAPAPGANLVNGILCLLVAVALPMVYTSNEIHKESERAEFLMRDGRLWKAWQIIDQLVAVGSRTPIAGQLPRQQMDFLALQLRQRLESIQRPLAADATDQQRIERAESLMTLDMMDEARELLVSLRKQQPQTYLYLAATYEVQGKMRESVDATRNAIELLAQQGEVREDINRLREIAYGRLADYLRRIARYREAEEVLLAGLRRWDKSKAYFHFQLGYHYQQGGRSRKALAAYEQAANLDENFTQPVELAVKDLKLNTPACLLRPAGTATR